MNSGLTFAPLENPSLRVISFGGGVQSTVMLLMALAREIGPLPDAVIMADTGWEGTRTYADVEWVRDLVKRMSNDRIEFIVTSAGNLRDMQLAKSRNDPGRFVSVPYFTGNGGQGRRQCTREFKLEPLIQAQRDLLGMKKGQRVPIGIQVEVWIGISLDEMIRAKHARKPWQVNRFPLIEAGMSRNDCRSWLDMHGFPQPPKSACVGCPYRDDWQWAEMARNAPEDFEDACLVDDLIRDGGTGMVNQQFTHRSLRPLREVAFAGVENRDLFDHDCEGMCGT
jgi:hypothetical protein